jgi:DNA helicase-2/ATP-dependent DNA helicase PcrA
VQKVQVLARAQGTPLVNAAALILDSDELTPQARRALGNLVGDIGRWRNAVAVLSPADLVRQILEECGYTSMLKAEKSPESAGRLENLSELARALEEYETLGDFLEHVSLVMDNDANDSSDKVTIMTIHAAKGLEFQRTFLVGWEEGIFPSQRALDEGGLASLEEERRLGYVAITRAREQCTITHAANRRIYGQWNSSIPSRFIDELPADHIEAESTLYGGGASTAWQPSARLEPQKLVQARTPLKPVEWSQPARTDIAIGSRVFHTKFGYGVVAEIDGNRLEIEFEVAGRKRVLDSFVSPA